MTEHTQMVMGQGIREYKPRLTIHSLLNRFTKQRYAFSPMQSAVIVGNKEFPDVSFWQGVINWDIMRQKTDTVILRVGQNTWEDPQFKRNYAESKAHGMLRGLYYFYDDRASPKAQGDTFLRAIGNDVPEMEVYADWEYVYGGSYGGLKNVVAFMEYIEARATIKTGLYTGYYFFKDHSNAVTNASQYNYLKVRPLWEAWYTANPALVLIPAPWTSLLLWQRGTPSVGGQYGVESVEIDMNRVNLTDEQFYARYKNGGVVDPPPPVPASEYQTFRRFESDCHLTILDPKQYRMLVTNTGGKLETTSSTAKRYGAKWAINGDMWATNKPLSLAASDGDLYQPVQYETNPFFNQTKTGILQFGHKATADLYNAVSGSHYIILSGTVNTALFSTSATMTEKHPRTAIGVDAGGRIMLLVVEGRDSTDSGVTLAQLANILIEFGCQAAIALDGGGSSTMCRDGAVVNFTSDGAERPVINHVLFIPIGGIPMAQRYTFKSNVTTETRSIRNGNGVTFTKQRDLPAGGSAVIDFIYTYPAAYTPNQANMGDKWCHIENTNEWLALIHQGKTYGVLTALPDPVTEPKVVSTTASISNTYIYDDGTTVTVKAENVELK